MLQHNGRLANPLDDYTRQLRALTGKRKKTDDDLVTIMAIEARGGAYETADGFLGVPNEYVWASIYEAAKAYRRGEDIKRALLMDLDVVEPLDLGAGPVPVDAFLADPAHVDYRPVGIGGKRTMRARPRIVPPWTSTHEAELLDDVIDLRDLAPIAERAGRLVGVGDRRPLYGTYELRIEAA
jgi:hypothetical protein